MTNQRQKILFLCTGNSCRSQMAEGWTRHLHNDKFEVWSAGIEKHGLNPMAIEAMKQAGVDISCHSSKLLSELSHIRFDMVVTVCGNAEERCPVFPGTTRVVHHGFDDPPKLAEKHIEKSEKLACYLRVCDEIRDFVQSM